MARLAISSLVVLGVLGGPMLLGGCLGHKTIEPLEGASPLSDNPNDPPVPEAIATALTWVVDRYPPGGEEFLGRNTQPVAANLPTGLRGDVANRICRMAGKSISVLTVENDTLPIYHIGRVWVRGDTAKIDVMVPVAQYTPQTSATGPSAVMVYQNITLTLRTRGFEPYYVQSHYVWGLGSFETPPLRYLENSPDGMRVGGMNSTRARTAPLPATSAPAPTPAPQGGATNGQPGGQADGQPSGVQVLPPE